LFATWRALFTCNSYLARQYFNDGTYDLLGLGDSFVPGAIGFPASGFQILGSTAYGGGSVNLFNFNITGNDPVNIYPISQPVRSYSVTTIGAKPILIAVGPTSDGDVQKMTDITSYTLSQSYAGNLGRTTDLLGPTVGEPMNFFVPEALSGAYNVFEYTIPQSAEFHSGQETGNCRLRPVFVLTDPIDLNTPVRDFPGAVNRFGVLGTGNMTKYINAAPNGNPVLGYFFWSQGNVKGLTNTKYLKVNGIDPLLSQFGTLPEGCPSPFITTRFPAAPR